MPLIAYRDFYYPLNVFMHILTHEEGAVRYLHYGLFDAGGNLDVRLTFDHRVLDGAPMARALADCPHLPFVAFDG